MPLQRSAASGSRRAGGSCSVDSGGGARLGETILQILFTLYSVTHKNYEMRIVYSVAGRYKSERWLLSEMRFRFGVEGRSGRSVSRSVRVVKRS